MSFRGPEAHHDRPANQVRAPSSESQINRILENLFECLEELRAGGAVHHAMVAGERHAAAEAHFDLALHDHRFLGHHAHG